MADKKRSQKIHAKKRALERYGLHLNNQQFKEMSNAVKSGKGETLLRQSHTRRIASLNHEGQDLYVAYDKSRGQIATFLTEDMVKELLGEEELNEHIDCRSMRNSGSDATSGSGSVGYQHDQGMESDLEQE